MGCAQSRIENEESVSRCKDRRQFMKDAVAARNAFAAAHSSFIVALKNTGAALSDFAQSDSPDPTIPTTTSQNPNPNPNPNPNLNPSSSSSSTPTPIDNLLPPPPPLPEFSPSPLHRSVSMPELPKKPADAAQSRPDDPIQEEEEEEEMDAAAPEGTATAAEQMTDSGGMGAWDYFFPMGENMSMPMPGSSLSQGEEIQMEADVTPEKVVAVRSGKKKKDGGGAVVHHQHAASTSVVESKKGKLAAAAAKANVSLLQVLKELDEHFLRASESAHEVSKMLEATRMHYHSNFADNRGGIVNPSFMDCCADCWVLLVWAG